MQKEPKRAEQFQNTLTEFFCSAELYCIACVINRPNYIERYTVRHGESRWQNLCRSAYPILCERAAKFASIESGRLNVFIEQTGKKEDRLIKEYHSKLVNKGHEFDGSRSSKYSPLECEDFSKILFSEPRFSTKKNPLIQMADLLLYPLVKGGFDKSYRVFETLREAGRLIAAHPAAFPNKFESKYYCF